MIEILLQAERALAVGQAEQAERLYRQAADADPRNSIAVVGLARVALDRDDDLGAYLLARRALSIDPENAAARRLADRLEEVMRYRGETPPETPAVPEPRHEAAGQGGPPGGPQGGPQAAPQGGPQAAPQGGPQAAPADTGDAMPPSAAPGARRSLLDRLRRRR